MLARGGLVCLHKTCLLNGTKRQIIDKCKTHVNNGVVIPPGVLSRLLESLLSKRAKIITNY